MELLIGLIGLVVGVVIGFLIVKGQLNKKIGQLETLLEKEKEQHGVTQQNLVDTKKFINVRRDKLPSPLSENKRKYFSISKFLIDRNNTVWIGSYWGGLYWKNEKASRFTLITKDITRPSGFPGGSVWSIAEANDHSLWIANQSGFYQWFPKTDSFVLLRLDPSGIKLEGFSILADRKGRLWCGSRNNGLYIYDPFSKKTVHYIIMTVLELMIY